MKQPHLRLIVSNPTPASKDPLSADGFVAIQPEEKPGMHVIGTRIAGASVTHSATVRLMEKLIAEFRKGGNEIGMKFAKDDDLVVCVWFPSSISGNELEGFTASFKDILKKRGLLKNPITCRLSKPSVTRPH